MLENSFKTALRNKCPQIGLWMSLADSYAAEVCAGTGFDWLLIDGEHSPNDTRSILQQLQALAAYPVHPIVRPPIGQTHLIKQMLDLGVQTLLIPMVESAEQARELVAAMQYPPRGVRGVGNASARASRFSAIPDYATKADEGNCLLVQVETLKGLENIDAIAATEGVDGVFIGPADLSASLGHLGDANHPDVRKTISNAFARILAAGKAPGILANERDSAWQSLREGALFVAVGGDIGLLRRHASDLSRHFREGLPDLKA